jgi:hypothetical protein
MQAETIVKLSFVITIAHRMEYATRREYASATLDTLEQTVAYSKSTFSMFDVYYHILLPETKRKTKEMIRFTYLN